MDKYLQTHWDARHAPVVTCLSYQSAPHAQSYRLNLAVDGLELQALPTATGGGLFSRKQKRDAVELIPWSDLLGAAVVTGTGGCGPIEDEAMAVEFTVYGCLAKPNIKRMYSMSPATTPLGKPARDPVERAMSQWTFRYTDDNGVKKISHLVTLIQTLADPRAFQTGTSIAQSNLGLRRRKYLVYVNPVGGAGKAKHTYLTVVAPVFQQSNIDCDVVVTQHQAHATDLAMQVPLDTYDCIVSVGGDGILSEVLQGIMKREDWKRAIQQPLGIIPGGSGNGLAASLLTRSNERIHPMNAAYALAKGRVHELDISTVLNSHQEVMYSFLSLEWAFIADVDIESERFRMFGGLRFTISAVAKILSSQLECSGKLRYLSSEHDHVAPPKYHERNHGFDDELAPAFDCFPSHPEQKAPQVDGEWKEISGDFHLFWGMNLSHGAADAEVAPGAGIDDGYYYLCCAPAPFSRLELARLLLGIETGAHVNQKQVHIIRTRAFTLEVKNAKDLVVVDGERFQGPKVQVEVHRALGRVMCLPHGGS